MIKVKVKMDQHRPGFTILLPYFLLNTGSRIVTSHHFWKLIQQKRSTEVDTEPMTLTAMERREIRQLFKMLKSYKGLTLVEVYSQDGTEVKVTL